MHLTAGHEIDCINAWELLYADDTMLMGTRARELNILLAAIEDESAKYNLRLNYGKCNYLAMNGKANIHFKNGTKLTKVEKATYLGGTIGCNATRNEEINNRMCQPCDEVNFNQHDRDTLQNMKNPVCM